jgi:hypothetical protein
MEESCDGLPFAIDTRIASMAKRYLHLKIKAFINMTQCSMVNNVSKEATVSIVKVQQIPEEGNLHIHRRLFSVDHLTTFSIF